MYMNPILLAVTDLVISYLNGETNLFGFSWGSRQSSLNCRDTLSGAPSPELDHPHSTKIGFSSNSKNNDINIKTSVFPPYWSADPPPSALRLTLPLS